MDYIPHTDTDRQAMLAAIGLQDVADLFADIPAAHRFPKLELPPPTSELEILQELQQMSEENVDLTHAASFLGAGAYRRFIPSVVNHIISRSEFFTAYTPYQAEMSQGTLQALFEYQTMVCALTGMAAANGSHYDGATSTAEAIIMALHVARGARRRIVLSPTLHPQYRAVARTYTQGMGLSLVGDDHLANAEPKALAALCDGDTAAIIVQNPDFLGCLYTPGDMQALADKAHDCGALFVVAVDPVSLGLFTPPGAYGADIVVGEGQALGNTLSFGGPYLGLFACRMEHVRRSAGRIVGETTDAQGRRGFVLTLSTREQHIRRDKATSNICTNQALNALAAAVYLSALGKAGLRQVAALSYHKAHYAADCIASLKGYQVLRERPFFDEFVVQCPHPVAAINRHLLEEWDIVGGYDLGQDYPELANHALLCVTEMNSRAEIDDLVDALSEVSEMKIK
ncbi:MAG: aminomethyl-transferring glycine dehydrogenase subunit GcvPA [Anaerolineae bacterium]|nr:aminomethyl-transferring glycine dehydrogenase subunit GcvPA [Anaerolineae bacterium]